jgi:thioredoxin reductase
VTRRSSYDAIIVGGGPAGLSAALVLGRCRRTVLLCDTGRPRNAASRTLHGFLTRDGIPPRELLAIGRRQLSRYGVELLSAEVTDARRTRSGFEVVLDAGRRLSARTLLIATGVVDHLPAVPGVEALFGRSVFHCPYCDGWEVSDRPLGVYGRGRSGMALALSLRTWSRDVVLLSNGSARLTHRDRRRLHDKGVGVVEKAIARFEPRRAGLRVVFADGDGLARAALFFSTGQELHSDLPRRLGCCFNRKGAVRTDRLEGTGVPGLYVAGDASRDVQLAIVAAAEGAKAAFAMNVVMQEEEGLGPDPPRRAAPAARPRNIRIRATPRGDSR